MRKYGLIGYPLGHSFSKGYFSSKFEREQISGCSYDNYPLKDISEFPGLIAGEPDLCGLNVTIPYKSEVFRYLDEIDEEASEIGAVNVIRIRRQGGKAVLKGFNSDVTGIRESLAPYRDELVSAIILGTGGSSRAVNHVLVKMGLKVVRVSRTPGKDAIGYPDLDASLIAGANLIVNTTPLGMYPNTGHRPDINYGALTGKQILFDLVYNPELTLFLSSGQERGCRIIPGLKMLWSQAEKAWQIWNDNAG